MMTTPPENPVEAKQEGETMPDRRAAKPQLSPEVEPNEMSAEWGKVEPAYRNLQALFAESAVVTLAPNNKQFEAFNQHFIVENEQLTIGCIDERCKHEGHGLNIGLGGAGILIPKEQFDQYVAFIVHTAINKKVKHIVINAHEGCGAAKLSLGKADATNVDVKDHALQFARKLQAAVAQAIPGINVVEKLVSSAEMMAPELNHNAVGATVDLTGEFDAARMSDTEANDLPPMFNVNGQFDFEHAVANVGVALSIAFGGHGFGAERFSADRPFLIVVVLKQGVDHTSFVARLQVAAQAFVQNYNTQSMAQLGAGALQITDEFVVVKAVLKP